jgi:hypothetical protein
VSKCIDMSTIFRMFSGLYFSTSLWTCDGLLFNSLELNEVTLVNLKVVLMQVKNFQILKCDSWTGNNYYFYVFIITLSPRITRFFQVYCINKRPQGRWSLLSVCRSQFIITWRDSSSPNWQYTNMDTIDTTYTIAACAISTWSPQLCQMKHMIISWYMILHDII